MFCEEDVLKMTGFDVQNNDINVIHPIDVFKSEFKTPYSFLIFDFGFVQWQLTKPHLINLLGCTKSSCF